MARRWLSFWNQKTRRAQRGACVAHASDADIWVPYGADQIAVGDVVYCVAIEHGDLLLFGKLTVGRMEVDADHAESVDVWAKLRSDMWSDPAATVAASSVDKLRFVKSDGTEDRFKRTASGSISGSPFQGRASLRELVAGHEALDRLL